MCERVGTRNEKMNDMGVRRQTLKVHTRNMFLEAVLFEMKGVIEGEGCDKCTGGSCYCCSGK